MYKESRQFEDEPVLEKIKEKYLNSSLPLKIAKTELLNDLGLPTPKTDFYPKTEIETLRNKILQRRTEEKRPLIVRVACVPDRFSMPSFIVNDESDIEQIIQKVNDLVNTEGTITHFILQNATPEDKVKDKIVGRLLYAGNKSIPLAKVTELYKGAKNAGIFDRVDPSDPNYERIEQELGKFPKPASKSKAISPDDTKNIYNILSNYEPQLEIAKEIFAKRQNKPEDEISASFEFSYRDGNLVFADID